MYLSGNQKIYKLKKIKLKQQWNTTLPIKLPKCGKMGDARHERLRGDVETLVLCWWEYTWYETRVTFRRARWWCLDTWHRCIPDKPVVLLLGIRAKENSHSGLHEDKRQRAFCRGVICGVRRWRQYLDAYCCEPEWPKWRAHTPRSAPWQEGKARSDHMKKHGWGGSRQQNGLCNKHHYRDVRLLVNAWSM